MDTFYDDAALRRRLNEIQAKDPALAKALGAVGLDVSALVAFYQQQLKAGLAFAPEDLISFAIKQHQQAIRPPAA